MHTYRVDFTPEALRRDKDARTRLMRDVRKVAATLRKDGAARPRYVRKRRTDRSIGYWFQFDADLQKNADAARLLKPYGWAPSAPPVLPASEWKKL
jgi:hypothetical protein